MIEQRAKRILANSIKPVGLYWHGSDNRWLVWRKTSNTAFLSGRFTALELEAIAWWVGHKQKRA